MRLRDLNKKFMQAFSLMLVLAGFMMLMQPAVSADDEAGKPLAHVVTIDGIIGPPTLELVQRNIEGAQKAHADVLIIELSTPGGLFDSTQEIVKSLEAIYLQNAPVEATIKDLVARTAPLFDQK